MELEQQESIIQLNVTKSCPTFMSPPLSERQSTWMETHEIDHASAFPEKNGRRNMANTYELTAQAPELKLKPFYIVDSRSK